MSTTTPDIRPLSSVTDLCALPEWMTLAEVAGVLRVDVETVRNLSVRFESGKQDGLRTANVSAGGGRKLRRVHRDDLKAFTEARRKPQGVPPPKPKKARPSKYSWV